MPGHDRRPWGEGRATLWADAQPDGFFPRPALGSVPKTIGASYFPASAGRAPSDDGGGLDGRVRHQRCGPSRSDTKIIRPRPADQPPCDMSDTLEHLEETLRDRRTTLPSDSYSAELFSDPERLQRKIMEEAFGVCLELGRRPYRAERVVAEAADLVFHLTVGLVWAELGWTDVLAELQRRTA